jgi:hypothetical protein
MLLMTMVPCCCCNETSQLSIVLTQRYFYRYTEGHDRNFPDLVLHHNSTQLLCKSQKQLILQHVQPWPVVCRQQQLLPRLLGGSQQQLIL